MRERIVESAGALLVLVMFTAVYCCGGAALAQEFRIIYPQSDKPVPSPLVVVKGTGAVRGATIEMSVHTSDWFLQDGKAIIESNGTWRYTGCYLAGKGEFNNHTVRARLIRDGRVIAETAVSGIVRR